MEAGMGILSWLGLTLQTPYKFSCIPALPSIYTYVLSHMYIHTYIQPYIYTNIHAHIHTYILTSVPKHKKQMKSANIVTANLRKVSFTHVDTKCEVLPNLNNMQNFRNSISFGLNHQNVSHVIYFPYYLICILEVIKNDKWCLKEAHYKLCSTYLISCANFLLKYY